MCVVAQNLFYQSPVFRNLALNAHYTCIFRNPRAHSQLRILSSQTGIKHLIQAYEDVLQGEQVAPYLVIDLSPHSLNAYRLRTQIFPGDDTVIYQ